MSAITTAASTESTGPEGLDRRSDGGPGAGAADGGLGARPADGAVPRRGEAARRLRRAALLRRPASRLASAARARRGRTRRRGPRSSRNMSKLEHAGLRSTASPGRASSRARAHGVVHRSRRGRSGRTPRGGGVDAVGGLADEHERAALARGARRRAARSRRACRARRRSAPPAARRARASAATRGADVGALGVVVVAHAADLGDERHAVRRARRSVGERPRDGAPAGGAEVERRDGDGGAGVRDVVPAGDAQRVAGGSA